jgi:hypothetical protein
LHPTFIPFLDRSLQHVRTEITTREEYQPGESCVWQIPLDAEVDEVVVRPVDEKTGGSGFRVKVEDRLARFQVPGTPGLFTLSHDTSQDVEGMLAVNPSPLESRLKYIESPDAIEAWKYDTPESNDTTDLETLATTLSMPSILRQRLWWWLVLGGLAALLAETAWLSLRKEPA